MSKVTNVILTTHVRPVSPRPDEEIAAVNEFLRTNNVGGEFKEVTTYDGGYKHMECGVYLSAFNHADTGLIVSAVDQAPWWDREMIQLFVKESEEERFTIRYCGAGAGAEKSVGLSATDLKIICNALNEVCNGIQLQDEFETRIGCGVDQARNLLARLAVAVPST